MSNAKMIELVDQIESHSGSIYVREKVNEEFGNYALSDLPTAQLAIHHVCRLLRAKLRYERESQLDWPENTESAQSQH